MELNRLGRVLRARWRVVALIAAIGFVSAFGFTTLSNNNSAERWAAQIALRFEPDEGQNLEDLATQIEDRSGLANLAAGDLLGEYEGAAIFPDTTSGRLIFRAEASTQQEARERANDLLQAYLTSDQGGGDVQPQLDALTAEAEQLRAEIATIQPSLTPTEQELVKQHEIVDASITRITEELVALSVADAGASDDEEALNEERREDLTTALSEQIALRDSLPPAPSTELSAADQLDLNAKQRQLEVISLEYERLSLLSAGVVGENIQQEGPIVNSITPQPASPVQNGLIGLMGGAVLAVFSVIFITRSRQEIWLPEDVPVPVLGEVSDRKVTLEPGPTWYDSTLGGKRKESVQAVRTAIESSLVGTGAAFGFASDGIGTNSRHTLAVDLAGAFASAGRRVLLVNADFNHEVEMTEYETGEPTLGSVLRASSAGAAGVEAKLNQMVDEAVHVRSGLAVVPAGLAPESPADALAGPRFRRFLEIARERFDLVITVGGAAFSAASQVLIQRTGMAIVAISPGVTTTPKINSVIVDLKQQKVAVPGVIMVHGRDRLVNLPMLASGRHEEGAGRDAVQEPISRLDFYPFPGSKRASAGEASLHHLVGDLGDGGSDRVPTTAEKRVGSDVVDALTKSDPVKAVEPVAGYMVARVEDIMTATPGQDGISDELIDVVRSDGYIPLTPVRGIPTMGERLVSELSGELGSETGFEVAAAMAKVLTGSNYMQPAGALDAWLKREFFKRHLARTEREPTVWQLISPEGSIQVLVTGKRLTDERLGALTSQVIRRVITYCEDELTTSVERGDEKMVSQLESALKDAHLMEASLAMLRGGGSEEARLAYPWRKAGSNPPGWDPIWSEGIRANIAPLQRLGLLPEPVLTESELGELIPA